MRKKGSDLILIMVFCLCLALAFPPKSFCCPGWERDCYLDSGQATPRQKEMGPGQRFGDNLALLRLLRMTRALDLTEEQAARIFPRANRMEKERMELNRQLNQEIRELRSLVEASPPDEARIKEKLARIKEIRESIRLKEAEFENFLEKNLTVVQRGKYVLFNLEFAQFLSRNLERVRNLQGQRVKAPVKKTPEK